MMEVSDKMLRRMAMYASIENARMNKTATCSEHAISKSEVLRTAALINRERVLTLMKSRPAWTPNDVHYRIPDVSHKAICLIMTDLAREGYIRCLRNDRATARIYEVAK